MILKQETDGYLFLRFARAASFCAFFCAEAFGSFFRIIFQLLSLSAGFDHPHTSRRSSGSVLIIFFL